jgi:hypothetical protein
MAVLLMAALPMAALPMAALPMAVLIERPLPIGHPIAPGIEHCGASSYGR